MSKKIGTMTGLQWALASVAEKDAPPGPDEFTTVQVYEAHKANGGVCNYNGIRNILDRDKRAGKITARKGRVNGTICNIYKRADSKI